jgi:iron complex transport system permease protein
VASVVVYGIGAAGRGGATPVRLALAGTAISAALTAVIYGIVLTDNRLLQQYNFWSVGALGGRGRTQLETALPFIVVGIVVAFSLARALNALALGDDAARALGASVARTRIGGAVAVTLLCGAATAAAGPMYFLGLTVPHAARAFCGPDERWILAYSAVLGAALMLIADVVGCVIVRPGELQAGVMLAVLGTPVFIVLVRRKRIAAL